MTPTKEQINRALGRAIHSAYVGEGMTAAQVAEKAGFSEATMTRILAGADIPVSRMYAIAEAIGVPVIDIVNAAITRAERDD